MQRFTSLRTFPRWTGPWTWVLGGLLLVLSAGWSTAQAQAFAHPGLLHTQADFTRMQTKVAASAQPWTAGFNRLAANPYSSLTRNFTNPVPSTVYRGFNGTNSENYASMFRDIAAAYATALRWKVTGDVNYANKSIAILNAWSANLTAISGTGDKFLAAGIYGYEFANAGEIMRDYSGWAPADFARFQNMLLTVFYPMNHDFLLNHNGTCDTHYWANWDLCNTASMLAIGVLCDNRSIYNEALTYYKTGTGSGAFNQVMPFYYGDLAQWQESGRDQGHGLLGVALAGSLAQMAYNQGDDLFAYGNNALLKAFEYIAKYNLGYEVPYTTYRNCDGIIQTVISTDQRGNVRPVWELVYNHYVNVKGLNAPYSALFAQRLRPEGGGGDYDPNSGGFDQLGYGTLAYSLDEPARPNTQTITFPAIAAQAYNAPDFSPGATASSGLPVTYSVLNPSIVSVTAAGQLHVLKPGTTTVYAQQLGDATYNPATVVAQTITVNQVPGTTDGTWSNTAGTVTSTIVYTSGSANLTWAGQTFVVGEHLKLNAPVAGGFTAGTIYTVVATSNGGSTFQVALQPGGTPVAATSSLSNGVGQRLQKWSVATNWSGGVLPTGPNATATFGGTSFANVPGVTLDGNITIGNLVYAANGTSELVLASGLNSGQLTFATAGGTPTITMVNTGTRKLFLGQAVNNARVPLRIASTQGLDVSTPLLGGSTYAGLRIQAAMDWSSFSGTLSLLQGTIELHNTTNSPTGADNVLLPPTRFSLGANGQAVVYFGGSSTAANKQTIGALDGTSDAFIAAKTSLTNGAPTLVVGVDNQDGSYDGALGMGPIGAAGDQGRLNLEKVGTGTQVISGVIKNGQTGTDNSAVTVRNGKLVLTGPDEYLGGSTVMGGTLEINGSVASAVVVQAGTLAGTGRGTAVTIGTGTGAGATLAPGSAGVGTLTATGAVRLLADATFALEVNSTSNTLDKLVAGSLTLTNATLAATDLTPTAALPAGATYLLVENTGTQPVTGTFLNQAEGSTLTVGNTVLRISYLGGTGNDVTLTVVSNTLPNLVVSNAQNVQGSYNNLTISGPTTGGAGLATLTGGLIVAGTLTVQNGGLLNTNCQSLTGAGNFVLQAGGELRICDANGLAATGNTGGVQLTGTRTFSNDASYVYNGTTAQVTGAGLPGRVRNLTVANASGVTLSAPTSVAQVLSLTAGDLTLAGQGLTLLSDASGTAMVVNANGVVNGTATVQRYIDPAMNSGAGYRHYSSPVQSTTVADLTTSGFTPVVNPAYNTQGNGVTPFPTVFGYNTARLTANGSNFDQGWFSPSALSDALTPGMGYTVNIPASQTVDFVGTLNNGPLTMSGLTRGAQTDAGWQLLGNPYPSPINWDQVNRTNVDGAVYVNHSTGQYAGTYSSYVAGSGGIGTNGGTNLLAAMQGFFVRVSSPATTGAVSFSNQARLTTYVSPVFNRTAGTSMPLVRLALTAATGLADETVVYFPDGATAGFDSQQDAYKLPMGGQVLLASELTPSSSLSINALPALTAADVTVSLRVSTSQAGTYTLRAPEVLNLPVGVRAYLRDAQTGTRIDLSQQPAYTCQLAAGSAAGRFSLLFTTQTALASASALSQSVELFPNPAHTSTTLRLPTALAQQPLQATVVNSLGQVVLRRTLPATATHALPLTALAMGIYTLRLQTEQGLVVKRLTIE